MLALGLLLSVIVPLFAGLPWLLAAQRDEGPGGWPLAIGYGYALGLLAIVAGTHLLSLAGLRIGLLTSLVVPLATGAFGWWRAWPNARARTSTAASAARRTWREMGRATRIVCIATFSLILVRMITLATESLLRPIFPWEAVSGVAAKARIWYDLGSLAPFVPPVAILQGLDAYTDADPGALSLPSLLLVWTANAIGRWHEGAVTFAWWGLGIVAGLAMYGHLRRSGAGVAYALVFAYILLSIPLVDMHIVLAGASQWIGAVGVGLAGCAFLRWVVSPSRETLFCMLIGAALALSSLASTWPWFAIFVVAAAMRRWPRMATKLAVGIPLLAAIGLLALMQTPIKISGRSFLLLLAQEWNETPESLILLGNWHLLFAVLLLTVLIGWRKIFAPDWRPRTWVVAMGLGLMIVKGVLSLSPYWFGGLRDFSYTGLQLAPMMLLWIALLARSIAAVESRPGADVSGTPETPLPLPGKPMLPGSIP